jgi:hypothetical protein
MESYCLEGSTNRSCMGFTVSRYCIRKKNSLVSGKRLVWRALGEWRQFTSMLYMSCMLYFGLVIGTRLVWRASF